MVAHSLSCPDQNILLLQSSDGCREINRMSILQENLPQLQVEYPDSDGQPMAENTLQFDWIVLIKTELESLFGDRPDIFVAGDLLWYPVEGDIFKRQAPDVMVAFGRPKGYRGSYVQCREEGVAPQVVFEILSPGNRAGEMEAKFDFYQLYGVQEYIVYDPHRNRLTVYVREGAALKKVKEPNGWTSPFLECRFVIGGKELEIYGPDGERFKTLAQTKVEKQRDRSTGKGRAFGADPGARTCRETNDWRRSRLKNVLIRRVCVPTRRC